MNNAPRFERLGKGPEKGRIETQSEVSSVDDSGGSLAIMSEGSMVGNTDTNAVETKGRSRSNTHGFKMDGGTWFFDKKDVVLIGKLYHGSILGNAAESLS